MNWNEFSTFQFIICVWLVSVDCLNTLIMMKSVRENIVAGIGGLYIHLPTSKWTACYIKSLWNVWNFVQLFGRL